MYAVIRGLRTQVASSLFFGLVLSASAHGTGHPAFTEGERLTAETLIQLALERNAGVRALEAAARAAEFRVAPAGALDDPTLAYSVPPPTFGERVGNVQLAQALPWPGKLALREEVARRGAAAATQDVAELRLNVTAAARSLFAEWAYLHRAIELNAGHQSLLDELRRAAESRYAAGRARQHDVLQAEVARTRLQADAVDLERRRREIGVRINALVNGDPQTVVPPPAALPPPRPLPAIEVLQRAAELMHPDLARQRERIAEAESRLQLAHLAYRPDFHLSTGYNSLWEESGKRWTVGVAINLPLNYGNKRGGAVDAARAELLRARWQLAERQAQLLGELAAARAAVEDTAAVIEIYQHRLVPLADDSLAVARADYRAGGGSFLAVIDAEREQLRAQDLLARARADYLRRLGELERWAGNTLGVIASATSREIEP